MRSYFNALNTTKLLDFLAWDKGRNLYNKYLDDKSKTIPKHKDPAYTLVYDNIISIKNSNNAARTDSVFPTNYKVTITKY